MKEEYIQLYLQAAKKYNFGLSVLTLETLEQLLERAEEHSIQDAKALIKIHHPPSHTSYITADMIPEGFGERIIRLHAETSEGEKDVRRYLVTNGLIPLTKENLEGLSFFYVMAHHLPEGLKARLLKVAEDEVGQYMEELETGNFEEIKSTEVEGVWIESGVIESFKVQRTRHVEMVTEYHIICPTETPIEDG